VDSYLLNLKDKCVLCLIAPPNIYGEGTGPDDLSNHRSHQIPALVTASINAGKALQIGPGRNRWSTVHVADLANLYFILLENYVNGKEVPTGYLLPESGEFAWGDIAQVLGKVLADRGLARSPDVFSVSTSEDVRKYLGDPEITSRFTTGSNSRSRGPKCRSVGWKCSEGDVFSTIPAEVDIISKGLKDGTFKPFTYVVPT
jgi:nucleoside-diphosphate-sugar epimerase